MKSKSSYSMVSIEPDTYDVFNIPMNI